MSNIVIICPTCAEPIIIEQLNCRIFRHGVLIENGIQIDPHSNFELCLYYIENKKIYGCGKPFQIVTNEAGECVAVLCGYI